MYKCKHFKLMELVPPSIIRDYGDSAWQFLDERALRMLDKLRDKFGKIIVNDWSWHGENKYRGFRPHYCRIGAKQSQHRFGRAFDCIFPELDSTSQRSGGVENNPESTFDSYDKIRQYILDNPQEFRYINALETGCNWLHFDVRNCENRIMTFRMI